MFKLPKISTSMKLEKRKKVDELELQKRKIFQNKIAKDIKQKNEIPTSQKLPLDIYPISQKNSKYSNMPYGKVGTIGSAGCGPLAAEYAIRLTNTNISLEELIEECINKGYRGYIYDENNEIIDGSGTKYDLFNTLAVELKNLDDILKCVEIGCPITLLIQNRVYHNEEQRQGNHFVTLVGIDENKNAILMDGNKIQNSPKEALVRKPFKDVALGIIGAWAWKKEKLKAYLK